MYVNCTCSVASVLSSESLKFAATSHLAATLVQEVPADSGNFPRYMADSTAVLEDSYSEVVVNVIDLALL